MDDVVVDGLGQVDDVETRIHEAFGVLRGPAPPRQTEGVDPVLLAVVHDGGHHARGSPSTIIRCTLSRLVPNMVPPVGEDPGQGGGVELGEAVLGQAAHAVPEADELPAMLLGSPPFRSLGSPR